MQTQHVSCCVAYRWLLAGLVLLAASCAVADEAVAGPPSEPPGTQTVPDTTTRTTEFLPDIHADPVWTVGYLTTAASDAFAVPAVRTTVHSPLRVQPYGSLWGNMVYATSRTSPGPFTLWVFSDETQGEPAFEIDARRTRIGVDVSGPQIEIGMSEFDTGGRLEFDFFGQFLVENRGGARLRHAYWELRNEDWKLLVGQTWDVISPLRPGTLNFSVGWGGGNIGFRRAQVQAERRFILDSETELLLQGSLNHDITDDFPSDPGVRRETADYPVLMGRAAVELPGVSSRPMPVTVGLSGHLGETGFDFIGPGPPPLSLPPADDVRIPTWSMNVDLEFPVDDRWTVRGEYFIGSNLGPFLGGIGQGVCPCVRKGIRSHGGWLEVVRHWSPRFESHFGYGIDDPNDGDSLLGRTRNQFLFGNLIWQLADGLSTGWEVTWWRTDYHEQRTGLIPAALLTPDTPGEAVTLEWMIRYNF